MCTLRTSQALRLLDVRRKFASDETASKIEIKGERLPEAALKMTGR